jgi:hypothetical protein
VGGSVDGDSGFCGVRGRRRGWRVELALVDARDPLSGRLTRSV